MRETIKSILAQTYSNLVVHVSDNASTDDTLKVIESIADPRIIIHRHEENVGGEGNFNRCIQLARGKYTAIFHADDIYEQDMVAKQVTYLEANQKVGAVFTAATTIDEQGRPFGIIGRPVGKKQTACPYKFMELFKAVLKHSNFLICPSVMARTHIYQEEIVCWRGDLFHSGADLDVWLRIANRHPIAILNETLMRYRVSSKQYSNTVRLRTERGDIFLVLEHYLAQSDVKVALKSTDWRHYRALETNDQVWRAINLFTDGKIPDAKKMLRGVFNVDTVRAALTSSRDLLTLLAAAMLSLSIALKVEKLAQALVRQLRKISKK